MSHGGKKGHGICRVVAIAVQLRDESLLLRKMVLTESDVALSHGEVLKEHVAVHITIDTAGDERPVDLRQRKQNRPGSRNPKTTTGPGALAIIIRA